MPKIQQLLQTAQVAARLAGKAIMDIYHSHSLATTMKEGNLPVTRADQASHAIIIEALQQTGIPVISEEGKIADYAKRKHWDYCWLVDPLDGTEEFIQKREEFTINIALVKEQKAVGGVVYEPCHDRLYVGSKETGVFKQDRDLFIRFEPLQTSASFAALQKKERISIAISRSHLSKETINFAHQFLNPIFLSKGSALKFMMLLEGEADLYPRLGPTMEWDTAAAHAILNASGRGVYHQDLRTELSYNKPDLHNPFFIAF